MNTASHLHTFSQLERLPVLPEAATKLLQTLEDENVNQQDIILDLSRDFSLTCKLLRIANSSFYGLTYHVASIHDALMILGSRTVHSLAIASLLTAHLYKWVDSIDGIKQFFNTALENAIYSQLLARHISFQSDVAFTAGLLHDIGKLAIAIEFPAYSKSILAQNQSSRSITTEINGKTRHFLYSDVSRNILNYWHIPSEIQDAVQHHCETLRKDTDILTLLVAAAALLSNRADGINQRIEMLQTQTVLWDRLELSKDILEELEKKAQESLIEILDIVKSFPETKGTI
ncbi:HDOD domain-containing protein [Undibacterium baiyunense]|uniref:HDOD domain-containing protein n=1 Tax=Undibacterium baiyunense TaxID=2828731 RepID=A0A941DGW1_9BURK|nr:HDOD domain-containing protein [Undibacterium baiyunense]MBR7746657.1 HDOD domain-containing protein [Undibacterium baiyunense]